jgi:hypothetical protein
LRELEHRYPDSLAIVGVHSGKFAAERETTGIRDAALRLDALHPTINDRQFRVWRSYAVRAWPTLVAIDPRGYVIGMHAGEFTADGLAPFFDRALADARAAGVLDTRALHFSADPPTTPTSQLAYPGKVAVREGRIAIADSGHHRVLVATLGEGSRSTRDIRSFGDGAPGLRDGESAAFHTPQGLAFAGEGSQTGTRETLYVADSGNHCVRAIELGTGVVRTVAGTGEQGRTGAMLAVGAMSSPWDLAVGGGSLYVAMAGIHQLWLVDVVTGGASPLSGSRAEELHDAPHPAAALAQPMGLCLSEELVYFTDSESSAVREADRNIGGAVRTIVGTGLFDFGDVDGEGDAVRLQHPQGIARAEDGRLLVADCYNGALKWIDPRTHRSERWLDGFDEPSGIALTEQFVFVAETNRHRIVVIDRATQERWPLVLEP